MAQRGVFDQRDVEIAESWAPKRAASKSSKPAVVRACSAGNLDRDFEKRAVRRPQPKESFRHLRPVEKFRRGSQSGPAVPPKPQPRCWEPEKHGKRGPVVRGGL